MINHRFVVQVYSNGGGGWMSSKMGGNTLTQAQEKERVLLENDSSWINAETDRRTRILDTETGNIHTSK